MGSQVGDGESGRGRFMRPLVPIGIVLVLSVVFLFIGNVIAQFQGAEWPLDTVRMVPYLCIGALVAYGLSAMAVRSDIWTVGTREVVYMAIGAALYGVLSFATNTLSLPSVSLVSLRPAIVIPIFFGVVFGPAVGFFTGFVGNVLGDALTGWGVFPIWDVGNGLIGLVAGLAVAFRNRAQALNVATGAVVVLSLALTGLLLAFPNTENALFGDGTVGVFWWMPLLIVVLLFGARLLLRGREELAFAELWGVLAIVVGIGFAAMADIWWNGYSFLTALLGEFVPAASSNLVNALILLPLLLAAWKSAQSRTGRS